LEEKAMNEMNNGNYRGIPDSKVGGNGLTYTRVGSVYVPFEGPRPYIGKYGLMREDFLAETNLGELLRLLEEGTLWEYLTRVHETASEKVFGLTMELSRTAGVSESLKAADPMKWVGLMNNCKSRAEEMVQAEYLYAGAEPEIKIEIIFPVMDEMPF
jgi:hypothetical protein